MKLAIIETGGKQYLVSEGQKIEIEKLPGEASSKLSFNAVLLLSNENRVEIGKPYLADATVRAEIIDQVRRDKVTTFQYHNKTRYRVKKGHRQPVTLVRIQTL